MYEKRVEKKFHSYFGTSFGLRVFVGVLFFVLASASSFKQNVGDSEVSVNRKWRNTKLSDPRSTLTIGYVMQNNP